MIINSTSEHETIKIAEDIADQTGSNDTILLHGDLGAGKSVFARAIIRKLSKNPSLEVPSPTFTLVQTYETKRGAIWHYDLYRLTDAEEVHELGWEHAQSEALTLIEWPERLDHLTPSKCLDIILTPGDNNPNTRTIEIKDTRS